MNQSANPSIHPSTIPRMDGRCRDDDANGLMMRCTNSCYTKSTCRIENQCKTMMGKKNIWPWIDLGPDCPDRTGILWLVYAKTGLSPSRSKHGRRYNCLFLTPIVQRNTILSRQVGGWPSKVHPKGKYRGNQSIPSAPDKILCLCLSGASWSPNSTCLHLDFMSTDKYNRHSRVIC